MVPLSDDIDAELRLSRARAETIVNYLTMLLRLALDEGKSPAELVAWIQQRYADYGFYDSGVAADPQHRLEGAVQSFTHGRKLLYGESTVTRDGDRWVVRTPLWYMNTPPEAFFFFDISADDFASYAGLLARSSAERKGVRLEISVEDGVETAVFTLDDTLPRATRPVIKEADSQDREWLAAELTRTWGSTVMVLDGTAHEMRELPALVCRQDEDNYGYLIYADRPDGTLEVVAIEATPQRRGIGKALLNTLIDKYPSRTLVAVTTNDNLTALRFFQRSGFRLTALRQSAVDRSRELKASIPTVGNHGIPLHDEIVLSRPVSEV